MQSEQHLAFETTITKFTIAVASLHYSPQREVIIETDASDYVSKRVLSQHDDDVVLHPVAHLSKNHTPAVCNDDIYDHELMVSIEAIEEWGLECECAVYPIQLVTDYKNCKYYIMTKLLNRRHAPW